MEPGKHRARDQWGPREVIALIIIASSFTLAVVSLVTDHVADTIPAWVGVLIGGVVFYLYRNGKGSNGE